MTAPAKAAPMREQPSETIERQDAQEAMGLICEATTLDEAVAIAAAFLEGAQ